MTPQLELAIAGLIAFPIILDDTKTPPVDINVAKRRIFIEGLSNLIRYTEDEKETQVLG